MARFSGIGHDPALVTWRALCFDNGQALFDVQYFWFDTGKLVKSRTEMYEIALDKPVPRSELAAYFSVIWRKAEHMFNVTGYSRGEGKYLTKLTSHNLRKFLEEYWTL